MSRRKPKTYPHLKLAYSPVAQQWFVLWPGGNTPINRQQVLAKFGTLGEAEAYADRVSSKDNPRPSPSAARDIMRAWNREGASEAWQTAMLYAEGDRTRAGSLVSQLDEEEHVRDGILSYGGLSLSDYRDNPAPWARVFG